MRLLIFHAYMHTPSLGPTNPYSIPMPLEQVLVVPRTVAPA